MQKKNNTVGTLIGYRPDGSYIYVSHRGILNIDSNPELLEAVREDIAAGYDLNEWEY